MRKLFLISFFIILPLSTAFALFCPINKIDEVYIKRIVISAFDANIIYVGSKNSLFKSEDAGKTFKKLYVYKDEEVVHIFADPYLANILYLATSRHLYRISDVSQKIFNAPEEAIILSAAKQGNDIYIGTTRGLYVADSDLLKWRKVGGLNEGVAIYYIEPAKEKMYLATNKGIYALENKDVIERLYVLRDKEVQGEEESGLVANIIKTDIFDKDTLYLGTSRGIIFSKDAGRTWQKLYVQDVANLNIYSLAQTELEKDTLYVGTLKGFFKIDLANKKSTQLFEGLFASEILWISITASGEIYLATPQGLFKNEYFTLTAESSGIEEVLNNEPTIREIQEVALHYNDTHPDKIRQWRNALRFRALLPTLSLDYDKTISVYQNSTVDRAYIGPRDWGVSFSWNVADLLWDPHQDDIDTRSRLNTQLRLDILDEINRVYFERLRLKRELFKASLSREESFQKDLRLRELTAIMDGYTGGYFSKKIAELNGK